MKLKVKQIADLPNFAKQDDVTFLLTQFTTLATETQVSVLYNLILRIIANQYSITGQMSDPVLASLLEKSLTVSSTSEINTNTNSLITQ